MSNKELLQRLVNLALLEVGTREVGGNNCGKDIVEYQGASWLKPGPWPWCAALQCWLLREWLKDPEVQAVFKLSAKQVDEWRCKDASAFGWEKWAKSKGLTVLPETAQAMAGDLVIFDFSHIGIVIEDQVGKGSIKTVEGNTNGKGERDSTSGDGVWLKSRVRTLTKCYVRLLSSTT